MGNQVILEKSSEYLTDDFGSPEINKCNRGRVYFSPRFIRCPFGRATEFLNAINYTLYVTQWDATVSSHSTGRRSEFRCKIQRSLFRRCRISILDNWSHFYITRWQNSLYGVFTRRPGRKEYHGYAVLENIAFHQTTFVCGLLRLNKAELFITVIFTVYTFYRTAFFLFSFPPSSLSLFLSLSLPSLSLCLPFFPLAIQKFIHRSW